MSKKKHKNKAKYWHDLYYEALKVNKEQYLKIDFLEYKIAENQQRYNRERLDILIDKKGVYI